MDMAAQSPMQSVNDTVISSPSSSQIHSQPESLEDQNIFVLLGVTDGTDQEKESFLDELQQVIWEDFIENDVKVLLTTEENTELSKITQQQYSSELEKQEKIIEYLEKLVPDLEEIMLEKALELKADLFKERVSGMRDYHNGSADKLSRIDDATNLMQQDKWASAAAVLNAL